MSELLPCLVSGVPSEISATFHQIEESVLHPPKLGTLRAIGGTVMLHYLGKPRATMGFLAYRHESDKEQTHDKQIQKPLSL